MMGMILSSCLQQKGFLIHFPSALAKVCSIDPQWVTKTRALWREEDGAGANYAGHPGGRAGWAAALVQAFLGTLPISQWEIAAVCPMHS